MALKSTILLFALLLSNRAFALKDIMNPCERRLTVDKTTEIQLSANEIAAEGTLAIYMQQGMTEATGYLVGDDFIRKNISPLGQDFGRWLQSKDRMFIFDKATGQVKVSGYLGARQEIKNVQMNGMILPVPSKVLYLFKDETMTEAVTQPGEVDEFFRSHARAVVIQSVTPDQIAKLQERFGPLFERYRANKANPDRTVRIGRRRAYTLPHFQDPYFGKAYVKVDRQISQVMNWQTGQMEPGDPYWVVSYSIQSTEKAPPMEPGDYLTLLDEAGNVIEEGIVSSPKFPIWFDTEEKAKALEAKFKSAHSAFLAKNNLPKPPQPPPPQK